MKFHSSIGQSTLQKLFFLLLLGGKKTFLREQVTKLTKAYIFFTKQHYFLLGM